MKGMDLVCRMVMGENWEENNELPSTVRITMERQSSEPHMGFQERYGDGGLT